MTPAGVRPEPFSEYTTPEFWDDELQEVAAELEAGGFEGPGSSVTSPVPASTRPPRRSQRSLALQVKPARLAGKRPPSGENVFD